MASGVPVSDDCLLKFQELRQQRKFKYIVFTLNPTNSEIIVEKTSSSNNYEDFTNDLPQAECKWAVYDLEFEKDGAKRNKICFFSWSPDNAKIKQKMVFASSRDGLRRRLDGIHVEIQGTEPSEVEYEAVLAKASSGTR
ncbi:actin depolymerizing factor [Phlebopus sp. FC_14]|nr:actin depolymerizing factor [Phlebopus sp. FC_14]